MSEPIRVGDLVAVIRTQACGCDKAVGNIFTVTGFSTMNTRCLHCRTSFPASRVAEGHEYGFTTVWRLKRIPPLEKLEGLESEEVDKLPSQRMIEAAKRYKRLVTSK